jgi:DeoR/GlpR family transcriptional regulator of sugar metabolism
MLAVTRKANIKDILLEKKSITVTELSKIFSVTEETIRRDLKQLEDEGFLVKTYGGAFIQDGVQNEVDLSLRETAYTDSKKSIAERCMELIHNGDSIFLDSSTTALFVARSIRDMRLTVVTNSFLIIDQLKDCENIKLVVIGGSYSSKYKTFSGNAALQALDYYFVDKAFISCRSASMERGITDSSETTALLRQKIITRSNATYLIADYSKFDKNSFIHICHFSEIDGVITDKEFNSTWLDFFAKEGVTAYSVRSVYSDSFAPQKQSKQ